MIQRCLPLLSTVSHELECTQAQQASLIERLIGILRTYWHMVSHFCHKMMPHQLAGLAAPI